MNRKEYYNNLYLAHHGILGQKWGIRRYQNTDGTLTEAGKKRLAKHLKKTPKEDYSDEIKESLKTFNVITESDKKNLHEKHDKYLNSLKDVIDNDYYQSEQKDLDSEKAYKDTYKWFEENAKSDLEQMLSGNDGRSYDLIQFHDFRKIYETYEDEYWQRGEIEWNKTHDYEKYDRLFTQALSDYEAECKKVSQKLLGKYGDVKREKASYYDPSINEYVNRLLQNMISEKIL